MLDDRHRAYSVWIWSIVTSGDPLLCPMVEPGPERRDAPGHGAIQTLGILTRRGRPTTDLHHQIVNEIAARIAAEIDEPATCEADNHPGSLLK